MTAVLTTGVKAQGNIKLNWVTTIAAPTTAVTVAEINAGVDISCYMMADGWAPSIDSNRGNTPARLCTTIQFEQFGNTTYSVTYTRGHKEGILSPGGSVEVKEGMEFRVNRTGQS